MGRKSALWTLKEVLMSFKSWRDFYLKASAVCHEQRQQRGNIVEASCSSLRFPREESQSFCPIFCSKWWPQSLISFFVFEIATSTVFVFTFFPVKSSHQKSRNRLKRRERNHYFSLESPQYNGHIFFPSCCSNFREREACEAFSKKQRDQKQQQNKQQKSSGWLVFRIFAVLRCSTCSWSEG